MEFNSYLYKDVCDALDKKEVYEEHMKYVCGYLERMSPSNNRWYFNNTGFLQVDVTREEYDDYLEFVESLVGCSHCYLLGKNGFTLMFSLSTLKEKMEEKMFELKSI